MVRVSIMTLFLFMLIASEAVALRGKVLMRGNNAPVSQAVVEFSSGSSTARAVTIDDGSYYVPLSEGVYDVKVTFGGRDHQVRVEAKENQIIYIEP
ncbi:MAG TPA: carboxypeptidase regulatory-like domain-containing protein [Thermoanaerobaculia bacterium]|nr:carboxypeptidase regulatory-like domain-containing protein [Thermoanaerobaculia bacterium]